MTLKYFLAPAFAAVLLAAPPARAEIVNLSCDDGGMLLVIDTSAATVKDRNPFQNTLVVARLTETEAAFLWHESRPDADYRLDKKTHVITVLSGGKPQPLSNPQCGKSAVLLPKQE
jgi:hypothetical protein